MDIFKVIHYEMTKQKLESSEALYQLGKTHSMQITTSKRDKSYRDLISLIPNASTRFII